MCCFPPDATSRRRRGEELPANRLPAFPAITEYCGNLLLLLTVLCFFVAPAWSGEANISPSSLIPSSSGKVVLRIIANDRHLTYTLAEIEALGLKRLETSTYWPEDSRIHQGVLLIDLLEHAGIATASKIQVEAHDNYVTEIPRSDWETWPVFLATRRDGFPLQLRKKGPLRIMYPKDAGGAVAQDHMRNRWIWSIKKILAIMP
ncbi:MAG: hypothetical protein CSA34_01065 [Desulfobulbus propionicus]|nr:MAG: hypothetical protein CSA34_01065 [Desulfobulbus propionicus]